MQNVRKEATCPFTKTSIEEAYGAEVSFFLHCHLRGYDRHGEGRYRDQEYYDKYGAPTSKENSWEEGYHFVEKMLAEHFNAVLELQLDFPLIAGMGSGAHLYKSLHHDKPWNWTGWVPRQKRWLTQGTFFSNRYFLSLRGNGVQNNLWDYHPDDEQNGNESTDLEYFQLEPSDRYRGGYWFHHQPFARYLHIIALKSHEVDPKTQVCQRYNYVVHPLAYRASIKTTPDNSVDGIQWCLINMPLEEHFGKGKLWGEKCHGLELFNDFTYYYSYQQIEPEKDGADGPHNSELGTDKLNNSVYYYWFDTYPMEFCVFLLDSSLARGVYFHSMSANDALYKSRGGDEASDPRSHLRKYNRKHKGPQDLRIGVKANSAHRKTDEEFGDSKDKIKQVAFLENLPYKERTSFGYVTLIDPQRHIREAVFKEDQGIAAMGLDEGEKMALDYLNKGRFFSTTGLFELFDYDYHSLPYKIYDQPDSETLCHDITDDMELFFTFLPCAKRNKDLVWRYTIMVDTELSSGKQGVETSHGYFKLSTESTTRLDLRIGYKMSRVKWLYFTALKPKNSQHRVWFNAIRGPAFGEPRFHAKLPPLKHQVFATRRQDNIVTQAAKPITPTAVKCIPKKHNLDFMCGKAINERDIHAYFLQVCPHQQDLTTEPVSEKIVESSDLIPPRILQSVHGFFNLRADFPTRLNLSDSWDKKTTKSNTVYFYTIPFDEEKTEPKPMDPAPQVYNKECNTVNT